MEELFANYSNYYYLVLVLQGICLFHSYRRGTQSKWVWIIVFLPLVGCIIYLFSEIIKRQHVDSVQSGVATLVNPTGRLRELEKRFQLTNTFANRVALADAYFENRAYDKAIELYEPGLTGMYADNEPVIKNLVECYYHFERYEDILKIAPRVANHVDFSRRKANLYYAYALEKAGKLAEAEKEFRKMDHRFSNYEARFAYGEFLLRAKRKEDAALIFNDIIEEAERLDRREKNNNRVWIDKAKTEWTRIMSESHT